MSNSKGKNAMVQGRIVWTVGDLFKGRGKTDYNTKQPLLDAQGQQKMEWGFGLAVPKSVLNQVGELQPGQFWLDMHEETYTLFPNRQIPPAFAMKYKDCDALDDKGIKYSQREGYEDCIVLACTTSLSIMFYKWENGQNVQVNQGIKCGDYVNVQLGIVAHPAPSNGKGKAGLYLNPNAVQLVQEGKEIINKPSGDAIFGTAAVGLSPAITPVAHVAPTLPVAVPAAVAPAVQAAPPVQAPPAPNYDVIPAVHQPAPPAIPVAAQTAAVAAIQAPALSVLPSAPAPPAMPGLPAPQ